MKWSVSTYFLAVSLLKVCSGDKNVNEGIPNGGLDPLAQLCTNAIGSYSCSCPPGYACNCSDINECATNGGLGPCAQICTNTLGSFSCSCKAGYILSGYACNDINECAPNGGLGPCDQICTNTPGSFYCSCKTGYTASGYACNDINECAPNEGLGPCAQICTNTPGSFQCSCKAGYSVSGYACNDINECATNGGLGPCAQICTNTPGSFSCSCNTGYAVSGYACNDINECAQNEGLGPCAQICTNTPGSFQCSCKAGYSVSGYACNDINECAPNGGLGPCAQICTNTPGSFSCSCRAGYAVSGYACDVTGFKICFQEMEGSSQCQQSRDTCSGLSSDPNPAWTSPFRDDTDGRSGGCQYQWSLVGIPRQDMVYRVCFKETEGSSQCQNNRNSCSGWSNSPSWSLSFRDDTDNRSGGCTYQWRTEEQQIVPSLNTSACRVCFQETEGSSQCQGNRGPTCSGWSTSPAPTSLFRDDTDGRSGGCSYQWRLECN